MDRQEHKAAFTKLISDINNGSQAVPEEPNDIHPQLGLRRHFVDQGCMGVALGKSVISFLDGGRMESWVCEESRPSSEFDMARKLAL
jgi:hypothetical protein